MANNITNPIKGSRLPTGLNVMGVYQLRNVVNGKLYIGSSTMLRKRRNRHFDQLRHGKHHSIYLQRSYNRYGFDKIVFEILEIIEDQSILIQREQYYIDQFKPKYNMCKKAESTTGFKMSAKTRKKMSKSHTGLHRSFEHRKALSKALIGHVISIETRQKLIDAWKRRKAI